MLAWGRLSSSRIYPLRWFYNDEDTNSFNVFSSTNCNNSVFSRVETSLEPNQNKVSANEILNFWVEKCLRCAHFHIWNINTMWERRNNINELSVLWRFYNLIGIYHYICNYLLCSSILIIVYTVWPSSLYYLQFTLCFLASPPITQIIWKLIPIINFHLIFLLYKHPQFMYLYKNPYMYAIFVYVLINLI